MINLGTLEAKIKVNAKEAKQELQDFNNSVDDSTTGIKAKFQNLKGVLVAGAKAASIAAVAAIASITKAAYEAYAEYEQLSGGIEKLFGEDAASTVEANAKKAFSTAGISANEYLDTATKMSASLIKSLGGNTAEAANYVDLAIQDMSDSSATFGTSMDTLQHAYQNFAKNNYTMLDELNLGFSGSKEGMEALLAEAEKITGQKFDINSYSDIVTAIHAVQESYDIAGKAAEEAATTIEGSTNAMKASWQNFMISLGTGSDAEVEEAVNNFVDSASNWLSLAIPKLVLIAGAVVRAIFVQIDERVQQWWNKEWEKVKKPFENLLAKIKAKWNAFKLGAKKLVLSIPGVSTVINAIKRVKEWWESFKPKAKKFVLSIPGVSWVIDKLKSVYNWWKKILGLDTGKKFKVTASNSKSSSNFQKTYSKGHAKGLDFVPYDNYPAYLHYGEMVLTRAEANKYRKYQLGFDSHTAIGNSSNEPIYVTTTINLDGKTVAQQTAPYMRKEINAIDKRASRKLGYV